MTEREVSPKLADLLNNGALDVKRWEDDDRTTRLAAGNARLPHNKLSQLEEQYFTDIRADKHMTQIYLSIRNKMLLLWNLEPNVELTVELANQQICPSFARFRRLVRRIHGFLVRHGYVNYGNFFSLRSSRISVKKKVIIIGAGASGIAAAKQLRHFGFDVVILEGRTRVGGRLQTVKLEKPGTVCNGAVADVGAMIVTGIHGNPIVTLMRQVPSDPVRLRTVCPIYDEQGKAIDHRRDQLVEKIFRDVGDTLSYLVHTEGFKTTKVVTKHEDGTETEAQEPLSLEWGYELVLEQLELRNQRRRAKFWKTYEQALEKVRQTQTEIGNYVDAIKALVAKKEGLDQRRDEMAPLDAELQERFYSFEFTEAFKGLDQAKARRQALMNALNELKKSEPSVVYMNSKDKRLLDFHFANLEYANGTTLDNLSAESWDQDDEYIMKGSHMAMHEGYGTFMERVAYYSTGTMSAAEVIKLDHNVTNIIYDDEGVKVKFYQNGDREKIEEISGDCVLCTVPLGVLKKETIRFEPPLPQAKQDAIKNMGFGNLNKLCLFFEKPFWNTEQNFFGHLNPDKDSRGEFFLFMSVDKLPVLIALMAGNAAELTQPNPVIIRNAMTVLQGIFGPNIPKLPVEVVVTRWHEDEHAYGCYSHIPPGFNGDLYDELAKTVRARAADGSYTGNRRVYFAGEHTYRRAPATVPGAWLSGVRAATKIANAFLGTPFAAENKEAEEETPLAKDVECVDLSDDDDDTEVKKEVKAQSPEDDAMDSPGTSKAHDEKEDVENKMEEMLLDESAE